MQDKLSTEVYIHVGRLALSVGSYTHHIVRATCSFQHVVFTS